MAYFGQIMLFAGPKDSLPPGWLLLDGATIEIAGNELLYGAIGTAYGGDGITTFQLPELRSRVPVHAKGYGTGGSEQVVLTAAQLPSHSHALGCTTVTANSRIPGGAILAVAASPVYQVGSHSVAGSFSSDSMLNAGGQLDGDGNNETLSHNNMPPYLAVYFAICAAGGVAF